MIDRKARMIKKEIYCPFCGSSSIQGGFMEIKNGKRKVM